MLRLGRIELFIELGEALSVLPERFAIEQRTGIADRNRFFARRGE